MHLTPGDSDSSIARLYHFALTDAFRTRSLNERLQNELERSQREYRELRNSLSGAAESATAEQAGVDAIVHQRGHHLTSDQKSRLRTAPRNVLVNFAIAHSHCRGTKREADSDVENEPASKVSKLLPSSTPRSALAQKDNND